MNLPQVLLVPTNPMDLRTEELQPLVEALERGDRTVGVGTRPQRGYGVTWWEVLIIYLASRGADAVVGRVYEALLDEIVEKAKAWYHARREEKGNKRPFLLDIRDEDGQVLRALEIQPSGEVTDVTDREREKPTRPRPESEDD